MHAFDIPCLEQGGFEADDLIATYVRQACEAGATATIVASDKDLMQLVNDCVVMYDTMKDKRIGIAEVIEKFGVPPAKVIEVQALIGDSTDNVPGVPGIGVKTAAQLIGEYGDLETLLARAGEIKQDKRRQTLIDNAEQARLSKRLVTLDDHVKLDVPLAELAVHDPDYKRLIAFLKAMEFTSLTRRVTEFSGVEAAEIEADEKLKGGGASAASPGWRAEESSEPRLIGARRSARRSRGKARSHSRADDPASRPRDAAPITEDSRRKSLSATRLKPRAMPRSTARATRSCADLDRLNAWIARARELGRIAIDTADHGIDPMQAALCGLSLALAPNEACYVPLAHRKAGRRRRQLVRRRHRARPDSRARGARSTQAAARGSRACSSSARTSSSTGRSLRCAGSRSRPTTTPC